MQLSVPSYHTMTTNGSCEVVEQHMPNVAGEHTIKVLDFGEDSALPSTNVFYLLGSSEPCIEYQSYYIDLYLYMQALRTA